MRSDDIGSLSGLETVEVILEVANIPLGSTVRKVTGKQEFTIGDTLTLYTENGVKKEIKADKSTRILSSGSFVHNTISETKKMVWVAPVYQLLECLDEVPQ